MIAMHAGMSSLAAGQRGKGNFITLKVHFRIVITAGR